MMFIAVRWTGGVNMAIATFETLPQKGIAMTHDTLNSLLERLQAPLLHPKLKAATVRYRFTLDSSEQWDILLHQGRLALDQTEGCPDCLVEGTSGEVWGVRAGRDNLLRAFVRGGGA